jgi:hypothetical protein
MPKRAVSITLDETNLLWLQGIAARGQARSLSDAIDRIVHDARLGGQLAGVTPRSVIGTIDIAQADPELDRADDGLRDLFQRSLARPFAVREPRQQRPKPTRKRPNRG